MARVRKSRERVELAGGVHRPSASTVGRELGIDEAGRGPAVGPMVLAAVCLDSGGAEALTALGVRDSKTFGASKKARQLRGELATAIYRIARQVEVCVVDVATIDARVAKGELNMLEREVAAELIARFPVVDRIIADGQTLFSPLRRRFTHLTAMNKAEDHSATVAAASIVAKSRRDDLFARIAHRYLGQFGEIRGGGYANAATQRFLRAYAATFSRLPPEARHSWPHRYLDDLKQGHIGDPV